MANCDNRFLFKTAIDWSHHLNPFKLESDSDPALLFDNLKSYLIGWVQNLLRVKSVLIDWLLIGYRRTISQERSYSNFKRRKEEE